MAERKKIDWEAIEKEYRLGQKTLRNIAGEFGTTHSAISKKAATKGWQRDFTEDVRRRTNAGLIKLRKKGTKGGTGTSEGTIVTHEDIEKAVESNIRVVREHRASVQEGRLMVALLSGQLRDAAENREEYEGMVGAECEKADGSSNLKKHNRFMKILSLPMHASTLRDLTTALKNLVPMERQAFNLDPKGEQDAEGAAKNMTDEQLDNYIRSAEKEIEGIE